MMTDAELFENWNIRFSRRRDDIPVQGSPNRTEERFAAEDTVGKLFIADGFESRKRVKQRALNELLEFLKAHDVPVVPWLRTKDDGHGCSGMARFWQVRPFISGEPPSRGSIGENLRLAEI